MAVPTLTQHRRVRDRSGSEHQNYVVQSGFYRPISPCSALSMDGNGMTPPPAAHFEGTSHHVRKVSEAAYTVNSSTISSSSPTDDVEREGIIFNRSPSTSPRMTSSPRPMSPVMPASPISPTTSASSQSVYWPAHHGQTPTLSLRSTDAIKSPCTSPRSPTLSRGHVANQSQNRGSRTSRGSSIQDVRTTGHSRHTSAASSSSIHTASISKRISDPIFQASSTGIEPAALLSNTSPPSNQSHESGANSTARRRLLSTAYEESETLANAPSTPRRQRVGDFSPELKSKFSHSPGPHREKGTGKKTHSHDEEVNTSAGTSTLNRSLAALRKSFGDTARPDVCALEATRSRTPTFPTLPPLPKGRKILGFLSTNSRAASPLPPDMEHRSSYGTQSSSDDKRSFRLSIRQRGKMKLRFGSKPPTNEQLALPWPSGRLSPSAPPPPLCNGLHQEARADITQANGNQTCLPRRPRQPTQSSLTASSQHSQSNKMTTASGEARKHAATDCQSSPDKFSRSMRKFKLIPRNSPKKRPSRPPITAAPPPPPAIVIRDSWIDISEDVQRDGSSAFNGFPSVDLQSRLSSKRKRTWNIAKPTQAQQWEWNSMPVRARLPEDQVEPVQFRPRKQSIVSEEAPRLPSLMLGRMTPIGEGSSDNLVAGVDHAAEHKLDNVLSTQPQPPPMRKFVLASQPRVPLMGEERLRQVPISVAAYPTTGNIDHSTPASHMRGKTFRDGDPGRRPRLHLKPNRFDFAGVTDSTRPAHSQLAEEDTAKDAEPTTTFVKTSNTLVPQGPLPALPVPAARTLPIPSAVPQTRLGSLTSAASTSAPASRHSRGPEGGDPTQKTMSTVGTSILFTDVDMALRRWTGHRSRVGSDVEGPSTPSGLVPSEQEIQVAAALARFICDRSERSRAVGDPSLCDRLMQALSSNASKPASGATRTSPDKDECNLSHATEATDILSELVAEFKATPIASPGGPSMRRGSNSSLASSRLLRTPERQQKRRLPGSRTGSINASLHRLQLSPSTRQSPGRSPIRPRQHLRYNRSRTGSIGTNRTYSQSIMSYCSTPVSSSAEDLTSLLEGLMETSCEEDHPPNGPENPYPSTSPVASTANTTINAQSQAAVPQTPVGMANQRDSSTPRTNTLRGEFEGVAAVLDLYEPGNTPARGAKRKEPETQATRIVNSTPNMPRTGSIRNRPSHGVNAQVRRPRRISVEQGLRRLEHKATEQTASSGGATVPDTSIGEGTTAGDRRENVGAPWKYKRPETSSPGNQKLNWQMEHPTRGNATTVAYMLGSEPQMLPTRDLFGSHSISTKLAQEFPPTPPLSADRVDGKAGAVLAGSTFAADVTPPSLGKPLGSSAGTTPVLTPKVSEVCPQRKQLFSPVPALVITDADVEAKCRSLLASPVDAMPISQTTTDDPFGGPLLHRIPPMGAMSMYGPGASTPVARQQPGSSMTRKTSGRRMKTHRKTPSHQRTLNRKKSTDSLDNYHTAPGSDSEIATTSEDVHAMPSLRREVRSIRELELEVDAALPALAKPEWNSESDECM